MINRIGCTAPNTKCYAIGVAQCFQLISMPIRGCTFIMVEPIWEVKWTELQSSCPSRWLPLPWWRITFTPSMQLHPSPLPTTPKCLSQWPPSCCNCVGECVPVSGLHHNQWPRHEELPHQWHHQHHHVPLRVPRVRGLNILPPKFRGATN